MKITYFQVSATVNVSTFSSFPASKEPTLTTETAKPSSFTFGTSSTTAVAAATSSTAAPAATPSTTATVEAPSTTATVAAASNLPDVAQISCPTFKLPVSNITPGTLYL